METKLDKEIVIHPRRGKNEKTIPEVGLLLVNPTEARPRIGKELDFGGHSRFLFNSQLCVAASKSYFLAGPAIGAPMAAMTLEKLIILGAKKIILCGWCGSLNQDLKVGDVLIPDRALSGEGTSQYYARSEIGNEGNDDKLDLKLTPNSDLSKSLTSVVTGAGISVKKGCVWSTDAVYREDRGQLRGLATKQQVIAVDMEFSALCSVASFRDVQFAAMLTVSDEICGGSWKPGFSKKHFIDTKDKAITCVQNGTHLL